MKRTEFVVDVTDEDAIDVWFDVDGGRLVAFSANYRAHIQGEWKEVIRYDTAHDRLHVHEFWPTGTERVRDLEAAPTIDYTHALDEAMTDLDTQWRTYRKRMERP